MTSESYLEVSSLMKRFGAIIAVDDVSLKLREGEVLGLIGPNGAGKSTVVNCLTGTLRADGGTIMLGGRDVTKWSVHKRVRAGIARTFQHPRAFLDQTALANIAVAALWRASQAEAAVVALDAAKAVGLAERAHLTVRHLSLSERRRLEVARALATGAKLLLLDEVMAGLAESEIDRIVGLIRRLAADGVGFLLVEHLVHVVTDVSDRILVLDGGRPLASGKPQAVLSQPDVVEAYLGQTVA